MKNYEEFLKKIEETDKMLGDPLLAVEFAKKYYPELETKSDLQVKIELNDETVCYMFKTLFYSEHDNFVGYSDYVVKHVSVAIYASFLSRLTKRKNNLLLDVINKTFIIDIVNNQDYVAKSGYCYVFANEQDVRFYYAFSGRLLLVNAIDNVTTETVYFNEVRKELEHKYPELYKRFLEIYHGGSR